MEFDFLRLKYLIKSKFSKQELLANELNISATSLNNKLNNRVSFAYDEVAKLIEILEIDKEDIKDVFFKTKC